MQNGNATVEELAVIPGEDWQKHQAILDSLGEGLVIFDLGGNVLYMNPAALRIHGFKHAEEARKHFECYRSSFVVQYLDGRPVPDDERPLKRVLRGETFTDLELRITHLEIGDSWFGRYSGALVRNDGGVATLGTITLRDISRQRELELRLQKRLEQQSSVTELGLRALTGGALQDLFDEATRRVAAMLEVEYCKVLELLPKGDALLLKAGVGWQEGLIGKATVGTEKESQAGYTLRAREPVIVHDLRIETRFSGPKLLHEHGVISGLSVTIQGRDGPYGVLSAHTKVQRSFTNDDANLLQAVANLLAEAIARRQTEAELRESNTSFRLLFRDNPHPMWVYDRDSFAFLEVNDIAITHYGYSCEEFLQMRTFDLLPTEDMPKLYDALRHEQSGAVETEWRHCRKDGTTIDVEVVSHPLKFNFGDHRACLVVARDISKRKAAQASFSTVFHVSPTPTSIVRLVDLKFLDVNQKFLEMTGYKRNEVVGHSARNLKLLIAEEEREIALKRLPEKHSVPPTELDLRTKSGEVRQVLITGELIDFYGDTCLLDTYVDMTDRKETEEQLKEAIETVMQNAAWFSRSIMDQLAQVKAGRPAQSGFDELTPREQQVLELVAKGKDTSSIASELDLGKQTVRNYLGQIYQKLGVRSRAEAIIWARERGFAA